ncbi:hypothetical protein [Entomobacter blattae]|uniref:hypothetical protein n=1 Tax=Entomobacter blattae TaxID=2762277 RepID=UPI00193BC9E2|nr:hypothetical protein [Entomobacter blattae]
MSTGGIDEKYSLFLFSPLLYYPQFIIHNKGESKSSSHGLYHGGNPHTWWKTSQGRKPLHLAEKRGYHTASLLLPILHSAPRRRESSPLLSSPLLSSPLLSSPLLSSPLLSSPLKDPTIHSPA